MNNPRRTRTVRNNQVARPESFYCNYGKHYVLPLKFENNSANKGICMGCAFEINTLISEHTYLTELNSHDKGMTWAQWHEEQEKREAIAEVKGSSNAPGWVYYVSQADLIKIGYAKDVTKRIRAYGPTAQLLAVHPGTLDLEKQIHTQFCNSLDSGREWFRQDGDLMQHIESVRTRFGDPSVFEHKYTKPKTQEEKVRDMFATREFSSIAKGAHYAGR